MGLNVGKEITELQRMTVPDLRRKYAETFREGTISRHKQFLIRRIIWRLQANQEGCLSERARQRAKELASESDVRLTAPKAKPVGAPEPTKVAGIISPANVPRRATKPAWADSDGVLARPPRRRPACSRRGVCFRLPQNPWCKQPQAPGRSHTQGPTRSDPDAGARSDPGEGSGRVAAASDRQDRRTTAPPPGRGTRLPHGPRGSTPAVAPAGFS